MSFPRLYNFDVSRIADQILKAETILLTTHKQCDGDGLGAQLGLHHALKKLGKKVRTFCVDDVPEKYSFLQTDRFVEVYEHSHDPIENIDLCLIFDTNDRRLVEPMWDEIEDKCKTVLFIDHHPILNQGPEPTPGSFIETRAASTGEIAFYIIKKLGVRIDENIALPLYTSIAFDTQIFRFVKGSASSHLICAELLEYITEPEDVHRRLFSTFSRGKIAFLAKVLSEIEYFADGKVAVLKLSLKDIEDNNLEMDDSRDVIDMIMNVNSVLTAALFRQDQPNGYKLSLRSKERIEILGIAENYGGGGHMFAAGAFVEGDFESLKKDIVNQLMIRIETFLDSKSP